MDKKNEGMKQQRDIGSACMARMHASLLLVVLDQGPHWQD